MTKGYKKCTNKKCKYGKRNASLWSDGIGEINFCSLCGSKMKIVEEYENKE